MTHIRNFSSIYSSSLSLKITQNMLTLQRRSVTKPRLSIQLWRSHHLPWSLSAASAAFMLDIKLIMSVRGGLLELVLSAQRVCKEKGLYRSLFKDWISFMVKNQSKRDVGHESSWLLPKYKSASEVGGNHSLSKRIQAGIKRYSLFLPVDLEKVLRCSLYLY